MQDTPLCISRREIGHSSIVLLLVIPFGSSCQKRAHLGYGTAISGTFPFGIFKYRNNDLKRIFKGMSHDDTTL